jgi:hypothetical protein
VIMARSRSFEGSQTSLTLWVTSLSENHLPTSSFNFESRDEILLKGVGCDAPGFYLASLTLMTESAESNRLTLVKPRSTWVLTSKIEPTIPNDPLDQVNTHLWSTLGQRHGPNPLKP